MLVKLTINNYITNAANSATLYTEFNKIKNVLKSFRLGFILNNWCKLRDHSESI